MSLIQSKWAAGVMVIAGLVGFATAENAPTESAKDSYPLKTCVVSDEALGDMGDSVTIQYEGREIRFCCSSCEKPFRKDPAKYLKKLDEAAAATQPATQPSQDQ